MMKMLDCMLSTIETHRLIRSGDHIIIGLSGGADSLAMTHGLIKLREKLDITLTVVHVNHMLRGKAADDDAAFVENFCRQNQVPCHIFNVDVQHLSKLSGMSFEEMGRNVRYEKFETTRVQLGASKIAIAQNRNDVVETFFINLFRGAGIDGLSSIEYCRDNLIIRPLLDVNRIDIEAYCKCNHLDPRQDHTNLENDYVRNRIRNELLPYLRTSFNPRMDETLMKTVRIMKDQKSFWSAHEKRLFALGCTQQENAVHLALPYFETLTHAEKTHLIRLCVQSTRGSLDDLSFDVINRIAQMRRTGASYVIDAHWRVDCRYGTLIFRNNSEDQIQEVPVLHQWTCDLEDLKKFDLSQSIVAIDVESIVGNLTVRTRKNGDQFVPLGMKGHKKLKDFFIDEKIPREKRDAVLLVCDDEKIIWIKNMRLSELCKITKETKKVLILSFQELVETS